MSELKLTYEVDGDDLQRAGEASRQTKAVLKQLGLPADAIRRTGVCMYEGEINMVIHADGGTIDVVIEDSNLTVYFRDKGPGIADIDKAMTEGYSTAGSEARNLGFGAGMGLPNMKRSSDYMNIDTELNVGTTITLRIDF